MCQHPGMDADRIRSLFLEFMAENGHAVIPRAPLVPADDPSTLFTGSGMQPLLPYLLGADHPAGRRLADSQTCLRAQDIVEVGDNRHTTFFEMLGNWSLGDYFKQEQIRQVWTFLTDRVGLDPERIYVTCFIGDEAHGIPKDAEAAEIWTELFTATGVSAGTAEVGTEEHAAAVGTERRPDRLLLEEELVVPRRFRGEHADRRARWPRLGDLLPLPRGRARRRLRRTLPPELRLRSLHRDRQLRLHGVPPHRRRFRAAPPQERRLRRRARAHRGGGDGHLGRVPDQPAVADRGQAGRTLRPLVRDRHRVDAGGRRPPARGDVPGRRRHPPEQQVPGLRDAPARPAGRPLRLRPRAGAELPAGDHPDRRRRLRALLPRARGAGGRHRRRSSSRRRRRSAAASPRA